MNLSINELIIGALYVRRCEMHAKLAKLTNTAVLDKDEDVREKAMRHANAMCMKISEVEKEITHMQDELEPPENRTSIDVQ